MKKHKMILTAAIGFGFAFCCLSQVHAQEPDEFTLEEITVTAEKRQENMQKVAIAMNVISSDTIKELGRTDIQQILSDLSNVVVARTGDNTMKISIRGISDDSGSFFSGTQASTPTVAMNFDGISSSRTDQGFNMYDIERVEVLYGPQATLYSTNTPGGIVNILTAQPRLDKFEGSGTLEYGNYSLLHTEGVMNAPINDIMAVRAAFSTSTHKGYNSNGTGDEDAKSARLRYLFQPSEKVSFTTTGEYVRTSNRGFAGVKAFKNQDDPDNPWTAAAMGMPGVPTADAPTPQPTYTENYKIYGQFQVDAGVGTITFLPSYTTQDSSVAGEDARNNNAPNFRVSHMRERSFELRMGSKADFPFTYILGLSYYSSTDVGHTDTDYTYTNGYYPSPFMDVSLESKSKAAYGNVTYPFTDVFRVTGGLRYSQDTFNSHSVEFPPKSGVPSQPPSLEIGFMDYKGTDYKVGIEYDIAKDMMFYTDTSTSYRVQGMAFKWAQPGSPGRPYPPEKITSYNMGLKSRLFDNRVQLNAAGYFYKYHNYLAMGMQLTINQQDLNGDGDYDDPGEKAVGMDENAREVGDAKAYGIDVTSSMIITKEDKLDVSISYAKKKFTHMFFNYMESTNDLGIPDLDLSGKPMTFAPAWTINAAYSHNFPLANGGVLTARIDSKYTSEYFVQWSHTNWNLDFITLELTRSETTAYDTQEPYHVSNFTMVYADSSGKWTFSGYVKNIEKYAAKLSMPGFGGGGSMFITSPRTYGATLTIKY